MIFRTASALMIAWFSIGLRHTNAGEDVTKEGIFVATRDWQRVGDGQIIPAGLHVRMNFQTGIKEAKLMDPETDHSGRSAIAVDTSSLSTSTSSSPSSFSSSSSPSSATHEAYDESLKKLSDEGTLSDGDVASEEDSIKDKFRSIETLKSELEDAFNAEVETDANIMKKMLKRFDECGKGRIGNGFSGDNCLTERKAILSELEYYLHQYDNAIDFNAMGGLKSLVGSLASLNDNPEGGNSSSILGFKANLAHCLGSALSSNPKIQVAAARENLTSHLLAAILDAKNEISSLDGAAFLVASRSFYALAALTRNFPFAQSEFAAGNGPMIAVEWLQLAVENHEAGSADGDVGEAKITSKLALKIAGFLCDLIVERRDYISKMKAMDDEVSTLYENQKKQYEEDGEKLRQYLAVDLEGSLISAGFCKQMTRLTSSIATASDSTASSKPTVDDIDKTTLAVEVLFQFEACQSRTNRDLFISLKTMKRVLIPKAEEEEEEEGAEGDRTLRDLLGRLDTLVRHFIAVKSEL